MSARTSACRRAAFFSALAATGNQTIAAERAKVSRSWVSLHRAADSAFRTAMEDAIAQARARLRGADSPVPPGLWSDIDGEELVIRGSNGRRAQISRARVKQWTARVEASFLRALAASCNVKAACAAVGLTPASAYNRRNRWPDFDARWREALETGYVKLELALIENACNSLTRAETDLEAPMPPMRVADAIQLLHMHKHQVRGIGGRPGRVARWPDIEDVRAEVSRKIAVVKRAAAAGVTVAPRASRG
jgi:hypothetical protein